MENNCELFSGLFFRKPGSVAGAIERNFREKEVKPTNILHDTGGVPAVAFEHGSTLCPRLLPYLHRKSSQALSGSILVCDLKFVKFTLKNRSGPIGRVYDPAFLCIFVVMCGMKNKIGVQFVVIACVVMQAVLSLPHHHHSLQDGACFDMTHCFMARNDAQGAACHCNHERDDSPCDAPDARSGDCAGDHRHDVPGNECRLRETVVSPPVQPDTHQKLLPFTSPVIFNGERDGALFACFGSGGHRLATGHRDREPERLILACILSSAPVRAPSFAS